MIRFRYQPVYEDWLALNRIVMLRQFRFLLILACFLFAAFLVYPFALAAIGRDEGGILGAYGRSLPVLIMPGLTAFILITTRAAVRKRWRIADELREAREYEIDENGVRVAGASLSGFLDWRHFTQADVRKGYFILKTAQNHYHYFPAAVVPDPDALRALLTRKVGAKKG